MSISKELRERFAQQEAKVAPPSSEIVSHALGIATEDMREVVIGDIAAMLKKDRIQVEAGFRRSLDGYIFCLSRIIDHNRAWNYITEAFQSQGEKVPTKYYQQFGQEQESEVKHDRLVGK